MAKERFITKIGESVGINYPTVEDLDCSSCEAITGHTIKNGKWVCIPCEEQKLKENKK